MNVNHQRETQHRQQHVSQQSQQETTEREPCLWSVQALCEAIRLVQDRPQSREQALVDQPEILISGHSVQPILLVVQSDHGLVNRNVIRALSIL